MLPIGKLAKATGVKVPTIRYYEEIGLLPAPERSAGNQRLYDQSSRERLSFIRHSRDLGFALEDIRELLGLSDRPEADCAAADAIARRQLVAVRRRIERLEALGRELERMLDHTASGQICDCRVIAVLGNHALCSDEHPRSGASDAAL